MRHLFITAALLVVPGTAIAQTNCQQHSNNRVVGTVAGGGIGAVLGNVIAGSGDKTLGTVIGAAGGALLGNQLTKPGQDCRNAYGYYDKAGAWHANDVRGATATGYFDRDSNWVDGEPRGYYDNNGRWVAANGAVTQAGYRDQNGNWVPATASGYYDARGTWVANDRNNNRPGPAVAYQQRDGEVAGYWRNGRWIAGPTTGRYDDNGRWISGQASGRRNANGDWVFDSQPGYYDSNGRWNRGTVRGNYDAQGRWIVAGNGYNQTTGANIAVRLDRIEQRIDRGVQDRSLSRAEAANAVSEVAAIKRYDRSLRKRNGAISNRNAALVDARIDRLSQRLRLERNDNRYSG